MLLWLFLFFLAFNKIKLLQDLFFYLLLLLLLSCFYLLTLPTACLYSCIWPVVVDIVIVVVVDIWNLAKISYNNMSKFNVTTQWMQHTFILLLLLPPQIIFCFFFVSVVVLCKCLLWYFFFLCTFVSFIFFLIFFTTNVYSNPTKFKEHTGLVTQSKQ